MALRYVSGTGKINGLFCNASYDEAVTEEDLSNTDIQVVLETGGMTIKGDGKMDVNGVNVHVGTYIARSTTADAANDGDVIVYERFIPVTDNFWGCVLKDGVTLDLFERQGEWNVEGALTGTAKATVSFEDDATIFVDFGTRNVKGGKIVDWAGHAPSNRSTLKFKMANGKNGALFTRDDGRCLGKGLQIIVR